MGNKIIAIGILVVALCACLSPCMPESDATSGDMSVVESTNTSRNIVVLTDQAMTKSNVYSNNVVFQDTFESINSNDVILIDGLWIKNQNQTTVYDDIKILVDGGNPILLAADSADAISTNKIGYSTGFSSSADVYGIMFDSNTNTTYCYSGCNENTTELFDFAIQWVDKYKSSAIQARAVSDPRVPVLYSISETTDSFGTITAESVHTRYDIDKETALILTKYNFQADPDTESSIWDNWIAVSAMDIYCNHLDSDLLDYGPTTESSDKYDVEFDSEKTGISINGWSYTLQDSSLENKSRNEIFNICHDINEGGDDKLSTKIMQPGSVSIATKGNNPYIYQETELYHAQFYKDSIVVSDKYADCEANITVTLI